MIIKYNNVRKGRSSMSNTSGSDGLFQKLVVFAESVGTQV